MPQMPQIPSSRTRRREIATPVLVDAAGAVALFLLLFMGLSLPAIF